ncbi:MAG: hypothetical protein ABSE40_06485 [Candidatus Sulfotelmatobacter sp.]|jgi:hypothetical protein
MNRRILPICNSLLVVAGVFALVLPPAYANDTSQVTGSYRVVHKTDLGTQTRVRLQVHLRNRGQGNLHIQRLTLWDFSHPDKGGTQACSIVLPNGASADTTQEFTIPRAEYELWKRGRRPRLVLEIETQGSHPTTKAVRLDRISGGKVD